MQGKSLYKGLLNPTCIWSGAWLAIKKKKYLSLSDHQLAKNLTFVFGLSEKQKGVKSEFVAKCVKNVAKISNSL